MQARPLAAPFSGSGTSYHIDGIIERLAAGEAAQDLLKDVVEYVVGNNPCNPLVMADFIAYLADHGARVATDDSDCALENLIAKRYNSGPALYPALYRRLVGRAGELPFHILSRHGALDLSQKDLSGPDMQLSLRARDSKGRTLSHWLWDETSEMAKLAAAAKELAGGMFAVDMLRTWHSSIENTWRNQQLLQDMGVGMEIADHNGVTALELCAARIDQGVARISPNFEVCHLARAYCADRSMRGKTPLPSSPPPSPPGLRF